MTRRVAIVGAGPAGAFAAAALRRSRGDIEVDLFERLPTPWGLLRGGVAPDHQDIKVLDQAFERDVFRRGCRFLGGVEVGSAIGHAELLEHYSAVIYATGAQTDRALAIPGENLPGSRPATEFVAWYNGHPDFVTREFDLGVRRAVVIGNGNVAADVARVLTLSVAELERTDISDRALDALRSSAIEEVVVLGRRGPAQVAFTSKELRDLGRLEGIDLVVDPVDLELDPVSAAWLEQEGTFTAQTNVELLREFAATPVSGASRRIVLKFLGSPVEIRAGADGAVGSLVIGANEIERDGDGRIRARATGETAEIECGLVLRSVGYQAVALPDVPFDERAYVLPNEGGRVLDGPGGAPLPRVYTVGWIKRGPTGILGTNKRDAAETVRALVADLDGLPQPAKPERAAIDALLTQRVSDLIDLDGWHAIDSRERADGKAADRPRVKLIEREELVAAAVR